MPLRRRRLQRLWQLQRCAAAVAGKPLWQGWRGQELRVPAPVPKRRRARHVIACDVPALQ